MLQLDYILNNWDKSNSLLGDMFGRRLRQFLTVEQAKSIDWEVSKQYHKTIEFTKQNVLKQLESDVAFGFKKALEKNLLISKLMFDVVKEWLFILEDPLKDFDDYSMYGLPLFKAVAVKYGFDNPIEEDDGSKDKYGN